ncbi:MAG: hypothetical protein RLZZ241_447 [Bacteroidota bacterium]
MKQLVIFCALMGALMVPVQAGTLKASVGLAAPVSPVDLHPELMQLLCAGEISNLNVILDEFDCTLSAELTYNGIGIKLSITAKTCEEAGAGLAKAVKAFYKEASK